MPNTNNTFPALYEENRKKLLKVAYRISGNISDAEDILQDAFVNAYKAFDGFEGRSTFTSWIYKILIRCAYKHMKKLKRLPVHAVSDAMGMSEEAFFESLRAGDDVVDRVLTNDIRENCLQMFLNCMPKKQRIAFTLKVLMDLSVGETASIMNISEGAVRINIYRARQHMKDNMEGRCSLIDPRNPCNCTLWTKFIRNKGMLEPAVTSSKPGHEKNETAIYYNDIAVLEKIKSLYDTVPAKSGESTYLGMLRDIIARKKLKILS